MKTLFGKFGFPLLALIAIIVLLAIRGFAQPTATPSTTPCPDPQDNLLTLKIGKGNQCVPLLTPNDPTKFDHAMNAIQKGQYNVQRTDSHGHTTDYCKSSLGGHASIKTDKITTSEVARSAQVQGSAANDPNVMHKIASPDPTEIAGVLNTLSASP